MQTLKTGIYNKNESKESSIYELYKWQNISQYYCHYSKNFIVVKAKMNVEEGFVKKFESVNKFV